MSAIAHFNQLSWNTQAFIEKAKITCKITSVALSVIGMTALAYTSPITFSLSTIGIVALTPYFIISLFSNSGFSFTNKNALLYLVTASAATIGVVLLGGTLATTGWISTALLYAIQTGNIRATIGLSLLISTSWGYVIPFASSLIKQAHELSTTNWEQTRNFLETHFQAISGTNNYYDKISTFLCLLQLPIITDRDFRLLLSRNSIYQTAMLRTNQYQQVLRTGNYEEQIKNFLNIINYCCCLGTLQDITTTINNNWLSVAEQISQIDDQNREDLYEQISLTLDHCKEKGLNLHLRPITQICNILAAYYCWKLSETNINTLNTQEETLIKNIHNFKNALADNGHTISKKDLEHALELSQEFNRLQKEFDKILKLIRYNLSLPLNDLVNSSSQEISNIRIQESKSRGELSEAKEDLSWINSKIQSCSLGEEHEVYTDTSPLWDYLVTRTGHFQDDTRHLRIEMVDFESWLHVNGLDEIDSKFEELGLCTPIKLLEKKILTINELDCPEIFKQKIKDYFQRVSEEVTHPQESAIVERPGEPTAEFSQVNSLLDRLKCVSLTIDSIVTPIFYHLALVFTNIAPMIQYPSLAAAGFIAGSTFHVIKSLLNNHLLTVFRSIYDDCVNSTIQSWFLNLFNRRPVLLLTRDVASRHHVELFMRQDGWERLRTFQEDLLFSFGSLVFQASWLAPHPGFLLIEPFGMGGFLRGFFFGREATELAALNIEHLWRYLNPLTPPQITENINA